MQHIYHYMYAKNHYVRWSESEKTLNLHYDGPIIACRIVSVKTKTNIR